MLALLRVRRGDILLVHAPVGRRLALRARPLVWCLAFLLFRDLGRNRRACKAAGITFLSWRSEIVTKGKEQGNLIVVLERVELLLVSLVKHAEDADNIARLHLLQE